MTEKVVRRSVSCRRCKKKSRVFQTRPFIKNPPKGWYYSDRQGRWFCGPCNDASMVRMIKQLGNLMRKKNIPVIDIATGERLV